MWGKFLNRTEYKKRIITRKEKIKIYQINQNNKNKNNRVIYEALVNKLRMSYPFYIIRVFINLLCFLLYPIIWGNFPIDI